ncbi:MAG: hypothetical protein ACJ741_14090 [Pyrinomonadaceae bacterium]
MSNKRRALLICAAIVLLAAALVLTLAPCPQGGCAPTPAARALASRKNRTAIPLDADFDRSVTLDALLQPGDDSARWSESRAAAVEGYVSDVREGSVESANCFSFTRRDIHIHLARRPDAPTEETVVVEVTPRARDAARARGLDWSFGALRRELLGRRCRFEGWLLYDSGHADESENTAPGNPVDWRATAWELHPLTGIEVLK